jgi:hypothetical protein
MTLLEVKRALRDGVLRDGGYPTYFITHDGAALSHAAVRKEWRQVVQDYLWKARTPGFRGTGWLVEAINVNWEDGDLICDVTGERIPSAYAEPEEEAERADRKRNADRVDGYDRDDLGESPDF